eukprot:GHVU01204710.1.p1 GENE.GHVU01204710.1~~GHVU01204710.1.p1  ORF type:complete len:209 (+),score=5.12 GHVU01204710.1:81-629(+)
MRHHFTLAACPWSNGSIENLCGFTQRALRTLMSERGAGSASTWPQLVGRAQQRINDVPYRSDGWTARAMFLNPFMGKSWTAKEEWGAPTLADPAPMPLEKWESQAWHDFRHALNDMHTYRTVYRKKYLLKLRTPREKRKRLHAGIELGAYVLVAQTTSKYGGGHKLSLRWTGPHRIVSVHSN